MKNIQLKWKVDSSSDEEVDYHADSPIFAGGMWIVHEIHEDGVSKYFPVSVSEFRKSYTTLEEAQGVSQEKHNSLWKEFCEKWDLVQPEYNCYHVWAYDEYLEKFFTRNDAENYIKKLVADGVYKIEDLKIKEVK